jgi:hypothetical protein
LVSSSPFRRGPYPHRAPTCKQSGTSPSLGVYGSVVAASAIRGDNRSPTQGLRSLALTGDQVLQDEVEKPRWRLPPTAPFALAPRRDPVSWSSQPRIFQPMNSGNERSPPHLIAGSTGRYGLFDQLPSCRDVRYEKASEGQRLFQVRKARQRPWTGSDCSCGIVGPA